jgi:translation initiation factor 4E transporter
MFTPIKQVEANTDPETLAEMLQKTKIDVKPLLDTVLSSGKSDMSRVKGQCRLEDIEKTAKNADEQAPLPVNQEDAQIVKNAGGQDMAAFFKLVETMKTSGHLPDKPQPVVSSLLNFLFYCKYC